MDLFGPTRPGYEWQAREKTGFDVAAFVIDWENEVATCPEGQKSISWTPTIDRQDNKVMKIKFSSKDRMPCPSRESCIRSVKAYKRRTVTVRIKDHYEALKMAREREGTDDSLAEEYAKRAGIEGTILRSVRTCGVRRSRYVGSARTHLQHLLTAVALNFVWVGEWLSGAPKPKTRRSPFARLMAQAAAA